MVKGVIKEVEGDQAFALCLSEEVRTNSNLRWAQRQFLSKPAGKVVAQVDRISKSGNPVVDDPRFSESILVSGDTSDVQPGTTVLIRVCGQDIPNTDFIRGMLVSIKQTTEFWAKDLREKLEIPELSKKDVDVDLTADESTPSGQGQPSGSTQELDALRETAENAAVDNVPETASTTNSVEGYSRSHAIKEYVKSRADGICEGCGEEAPFTSKTGDPYLHAHHVHELSKGGSDTPDTVLALCPNCHYRVHHGEDGDSYNERLKAKLDRIEP
jgi:5-methylcytosine-specific restriction endonuclease McrA